MGFFPSFLPGKQLLSLSAEPGVWGLWSGGCTLLVREGSVDIVVVFLGLFWDVF